MIGRRPPNLGDAPGWVSNVRFYPLERCWPPEYILPSGNLGDAEVIDEENAIPTAVGSTGEDCTEPVDIEALRALTDSMPLQEESGGAFIRRMRDEDRY